MRIYVFQGPVAEWAYQPRNDDVGGITLFHPTQGSDQIGNGEGIVFSNGPETAELHLIVGTVPVPQHGPRIAIPVGTPPPLPEPVAAKPKKPVASTTAPRGPKMR